MRGSSDTGRTSIRYRAGPELCIALDVTNCADFVTYGSNLGLRKIAWMYQYEKLVSASDLVSLTNE